MSRHLKTFNIDGLIRVLCFMVTTNCQAAAYLQPFENGEPVPEADPANITHPEGYTGSGGEINVNVCITPNSDDQQQMIVPLENAVRTWNALVPKTDNFVISGSGVSGFDFESVLLHEIGHCIGLDHVNLASDSGVGGSSRDYSRSGNGENNTFDLNPGADGVIGSADDVRGDDVNKNWFRKSNNDPFTIGSIVDSSTYSVLLSDLPASENYVASASRDVAAFLGYGNSEAVMNQGTPTQEAQRDLGHDDVAGVRLAMSGLDETQGTSDDYTLKLNSLGVSNSAACDITVTIDSQESGFAYCAVGFLNQGVGHRRLFLTSITMGGNFNWHFNQISNAADSDGDGVLDAIENTTCMNATDADTDDDGLSDGVEDANRNGIVDLGETNPCDVDSDDDFIQDGTESGLTVGVVGTDNSIFIPDADPATTTSPILQDSDGDNFSDGEEDLNFDGEVDAGESDPNNSNSVPLQVRSIPWWPLPLQLLLALLTLSLIANVEGRRSVLSGQ